jgi:hypothetical protein
LEKEGKIKRTDLVRNEEILQRLKERNPTNIKKNED